MLKEKGQNAIENLLHRIPLKGKICPKGAEFVEHVEQVGWRSLFFF